MSFIVDGGWRHDWAGEYLLNDVIVAYNRSNDSIDELVSLRQTPVDLNVFVSISQIRKSDNGLLNSAIVIGNLTDRQG